MRFQYPTVVDRNERWETDGGRGWSRVLEVERWPAYGSHNYKTSKSTEASLTFISGGGDGVAIYIDRFNFSF